MTTATITRRKYHYPALVLVVAAALVMLAVGRGPAARAADTVSGPLPPSAPLAVSAAVRGGGVVVSWQPAAAGDYPVGGYIISKRAASGVFADIARSSGLTYTDPGGHSADVYQITAFDSQAPSLLSRASDPAAAAPPPAGTPEPALSAAQLGAVVQPAAADASNKLALLADHSSNMPDNVLHTLVTQFIASKDTLITHAGQLSPAARLKAAQDCSKQEDVLETLMSSATENLQLNLIEALARCQLLAP